MVLFRRRKNKDRFLRVMLYGKPGYGKITMIDKLDLRTEPERDIEWPWPKAPEVSK